jgi:peptide-methionine (S)-S-oxide reductase
VGYSGGLQPDPTYQNIMDYTEALLVEYDPSIITFEGILKKWRSFGQPYPAKTQYKWAVFAMNNEQARVANEFCAGEKYIAIEPVTTFYMAEEYHQDFMKKTGNLRY